MKVLVLFVVIVSGVFTSGCAALLLPVATVALLGDDRDCKKENQTVFSSVGCTGTRIRDAVTSPFSEDKKDPPATGSVKDVAPTKVAKPSKKKAPIIRKDRRKK